MKTSMLLLTATLLFPALAHAQEPHSPPQPDEVCRRGANGSWNCTGKFSTTGALSSATGGVMIVPLPANAAEIEVRVVPGGGGSSMH